MKLTIIATLAPDDRYPDADTGRLDADNRQASEPIRVLPKGERKPHREPEPELEPEPQLEVDKGFSDVSRFLAYSDADLRAISLSYVLMTDLATVVALLKQGDANVVNYYWDSKSDGGQTRREAREKHLEELRRAWEERMEKLKQAREQAWERRSAEWEEEEIERQASLMFWVFRNKIVKVEGWETANREEVVARVTHKVLSEEKSFAKLKREIDLFEKLEKASPLSREPIPEDVRIFVWRRDEGRCVRCGSQQRIEFDHIIPLEKGGSNTARNIQVLCERCNREKGTTV